MTINYDPLRFIIDVPADRIDAVMQWCTDNNITREYVGEYWGIKPFGASRDYGVNYLVATPDDGVSVALKLRWSDEIGIRPQVVVSDEVRKQLAEMGIPLVSSPLEQK